jgi:NAD(P)-dependent dehydrogenase (short-subunit alcohol dehydrogenase family)
MSTSEDLAETVALVADIGSKVHSVVADVSDLGEVTQAVDEGVAALGRLDIVAANAGIAGYGRAHELLAAEWRTMIDINLTGVWNTVRAAIPHMRAANRGGAIVITSSAAGLVAYENMAHYVAAKHGLIGLMRALALELAPDFIRVNTIHPASVDTPMIDNELTWSLFSPGAGSPSRVDQAEYGRRVNALPIPWLQPEDISSALAFLVSDDARYITGVALPVDAGLSIKR